MKDLTSKFYGSIMEEYEKRYTSKTQGNAGITLYQPGSGDFQYSS